jgi:hypothetical protein
MIIAVRKSHTKKIVKIFETLYKLEIKKLNV